MIKPSWSKLCWITTVWPISMFLITAPFLLGCGEIYPSWIQMNPDQGTARKDGLWRAPLWGTRFDFAAFPAPIGGWAWRVVAQGKKWGWVNTVNTIPLNQLGILEVYGIGFTWVYHVYLIAITVQSPLSFTWHVAVASNFRRRFRKSPVLATRLPKIFSHWTGKTVV